MKRALGTLAAALFLLIAPPLARLQPLVPAPFAERLGGAALAVQPGEMLPDPAMERRARTISAELRCLVCQNQTIDDSDSDIARDLRRTVRERLVAGDTNGAAIDFIVRRYGEFVLLRPRVSAATLLLWGTPVLVILAGSLYGFLAFRRANAPGRATQTTLTTDEEAAIARLLKSRDLLR